jgi:hypothetical protein
LEVLDQNGALVFSPTQSDTLRDAVRSYVEHKERGQELVIIGVTKEQVRWVNEAVRRELGLNSKRGTITYSTEGGDRRLVAGDRIVFQRNDARLGVLNGYLADVVQVERYRITVRTFDGKTITFDPRRYNRWDYGHAAVTIHKSQGASLYGAEHLATRAISAESFHVATSRGKGYLKVRVAREDFADRDDLADHLGRSFSRKLNVNDYSALQAERKKGEELRRIYTERRARADEQPMVIRYQAYLDELNARRAVVLLDVAARYDKPREAIFEQVPEGKARAEALHRLMRKKRREEKQLVKDFQPLDFGAWRAQEDREFLAARRRLDRVRELERDVHAEREHDHEPVRRISDRVLEPEPGLVSERGRAGNLYTGEILSIDRHTGRIRQRVTRVVAGEERTEIMEHKLALISGTLEAGEVVTLRYDHAAGRIAVVRARDRGISPGR